MGKGNIKIVVPVCSSVRLYVSMKQLLFQWRDFNEKFLN